MAQPQGLHSLSTIIKRLEAVTSRLEDVAIAHTAPVPLKSSTGGAHDALAAHVAPPPPPPAPPAPQSQPAPSTEESSPAAKAYQEEIVDAALAAVLTASKAIGGIVEEHTSLLGPLCAAQQSFLQLAAAHAKPSNVASLLKPQADAIGAVIEAKDKFGRSKEGREWGACLSTVAEGVSAWGWVQIEPAPAPFVGEMKNSAQFWADRVTKQFKESNPAAIAWAKAMIALIDTLQRYVKQWHTTGVTWNPRGPPAPASVSAPASSGAPKAPPPPPPSTASAPAAGGGGQAALLAALNKGGSVTSGLRKVDQSQMTHKNPDLRTNSVVPEKKQAPELKAKPAVAAARKPARTELEDGNKWIIASHAFLLKFHANHQENHEGNREISIDNTELHHTVHVFGCTNSVIKISGKINAVSMVGCKKTALILESVVSSLSITSSPSFEVQMTGFVPTVQIDTTDSGQVYLSKACMDAVEIITSKTSSINISVPTGEQGDFQERPVPEQMKSRIVGGKLVTEIVEHAG